MFYEDGKAFDTTKAIDAAITLTAKAKEYKVTFDSDVAPQTIKYNGTATEPTAPTKEGFEFVGWYEGETKFNFATKITKDISLTAKWEEKKATEPEVSNDALTTTFKFGETYSGTVTYPMIANGDWGNATASEVMFNIDLSDQSLKAKDVVKISFKITECSSEAVATIGYQSVLDNWGWHTVNAKELGSTYNISFEIGETTTFEDNLAGVKFTPQDSDGSLIGKDLVIKIEDLSVTLVPYVEGAKQTKVLYEGEGFAPYDDTFLASDLQTALDSSTGDASLIITYKLGDYTPEHDYDGVAILAGWDKDWKDSTDNFTAYSINTGCNAADYVVGTEKEKSFAVSDILTDLSNTFRFTINIYNNKIVITNIKVEYTAK